MAKESLTQKGTSELKLKDMRGQPMQTSRRRVIQAKGIAGVKALRHVFPWCVGEQHEGPVCLPGHTPEGQEWS